MFIQHQLIPSIRTSTHPIELKLVKVLLEKSKLFGLASNSANFVFKKTNKKDKNTIKTNNTEAEAHSCHGVFTDQFIFRKIFRSLTNQSANLQTKKTISGLLMKFSFPFSYLIL